MPRVVVLATGDELVAPGGPLGPGQLHNSNAATLAALATQAGARVLRTGVVADTEEATRAAIAAALDEADVLVLSGGVSVGPHDHVKPALQALGVDEVFWRVALRPGRPTWFGTRDDTAGLRAAGQPGLRDGHLHALRAARARGDAGRARTSPSGSSPTWPRRSPAIPIATSACACGCATAWPCRPARRAPTSSARCCGADGFAIVTAGEGSALPGDQVVVELA